jgi:nucleoside-diphosphate-sugar epimerase
MTFAILGCGYTGVRVAGRLLAKGHQVIATTRTPARLAGLAARGALILEVDVETPANLKFIPAGARILYSIPSVTPEVLTALSQPSRIIYLSTTGVYGAKRDVDETTPVAPRTPREQLRVDAERAICAGEWSSLVLRPAAIYGPGRGIHVSMARGDFRLVGDGSNFVSRIHVRDLAAHAEAALMSDVTGAYPVADEEPCESREIAQFCASLLGLPMPSMVHAADVHDTRRADRRVDGRAIRNLLGITLRYPSYRVGVPASNDVTTEYS